MGFFQEWIERADQANRSFAKATERLLLKSMSDETTAAILQQGRREIAVTNMTSDLMRLSRIIKTSADQLMLFAELERVHGQDYAQLRSPFSVVYIDPVNGEMITRYQGKTAVVKGMLIIFNDTRLKESVRISADDDVLRESYGLTNADRIIAHIQTTWFIPLDDAPENNYVTSLCLTDDGQLHNARIDMCSGPVDLETRETMTTWLIHILNFLTSPAVVLTSIEPSAALQKARAKRGKSALPGWYEISYKKTATRRESNVSGEGSKHGFRYDVRGHFMHFLKGRLAGRVIWCPPHQRGVAHELYKPKVYRVERELDAQPEVYGG